MLEIFFTRIQQKKEEHRDHPRSQISKDVIYFLNQEKYLRVFLIIGNVLIDNSEPERSICPFTGGRKNRLFNNTERGASAMIYLFIEITKVNNLRPYHYINQLLTFFPEVTDGNIDEQELVKFLPWVQENPIESR